MSASASTFLGTLDTRPRHPLAAHTQAQVATRLLLGPGDAVAALLAHLPRLELDFLSRTHVSY